MPCQDLGHQRETTSLVSLGSAGNLFHEPTRLLGSGDFLVFRFFLNKPSLESFILESFFTELGDQFNSSLSQFTKLTISGRLRDILSQRHIVPTAFFGRQIVPDDKMSHFLPMGHLFDFLPGDKMSC